MKLQAAIEDRGLRLDLFLARHLNAITRSQVQLLNRTGAIRIDGHTEKSGYKIRGGEVVEVDLHVLDPPSLTPEHIPIQIHFEDRDLAVIEKPAGLVVHPGAGIRQGTVVHALLFHFQNLSDAGGAGRPGIVHRLDKKTSGLLVIAKNNVAHARLAKSFQNREIEKSYLALVHGNVRSESGVVELNIGRDPGARTRMKAHVRDGRAAHSDYVVVERIRGFTLLKVRIKTGRTHQIRVHLSAIGHPVVGDDVYGENSYREFAAKHGPLDRYFLHAAHLRFAHPSTGAELEFHSPLPAELQNVYENLKRGGK